MRNFKREKTFLPCALVIDRDNIKAFMLDFSRMGAMISTQYSLQKKKYISLLYQNEKNETVRMLTYVVHCSRKDHYFISGLQFVGIESRSA
jgi:hypothetical protein